LQYLFLMSLQSNKKSGITAKKMISQFDF